MKKCLSYYFKIFEDFVLDKLSWPWIPSRNIGTFFFESRLAGNKNEFGGKVLVLCSALKWRVAIVAERRAPMAKPAKV